MALKQDFTEQLQGQIASGRGGAGDAVQEQGLALLSARDPAFGSQQRAIRRGRRCKVPGEMIFGQSTQLLHVIVRRLDDGIEGKLQVADIVRSARDGPHARGKVGGSEAGDQQQKRQGDTDEAQGMPQNQRPQRAAVMPSSSGACAPSLSALAGPFRSNPHSAAQPPAGRLSTHAMRYRR